MKIYPAVHYTMGGVWVDYNLETNIPGLFAIGEANFSDHGANRLGASALMQGLADGYFVLPYTIGQFLANDIRTPKIDPNQPAFDAAEANVRKQIDHFLSVKGSQSVESFHRRLGKIMWDYCGMSRSAEGLQKARKMLQELREEFYRDVYVPGSNEEYNPELEKAIRVADFFEEALRNDADYAFVAAWEYKGWDQDPVLHVEPLQFEAVELKTRSYK